MFNNQIDFSVIFLEQLLEYRIDPDAVGSLEIEESHYGYGGIGLSDDR